MPEGSAPRKRQWGSEKRLTPLSILHHRPSTLKIAVSRAAIVLTVIFWSVYIVDTVIRQFFDGPHTFQFTSQAVSYVIVVSFLTYSALMYLLARQGAFQRFRSHIRVPRAELESHFNKKQSSLTVLIPSYDEEISAIRKTIISALIQEYPKKHVVLLVDDKPNQPTLAGKQKLTKTRKIGVEIMRDFSEPRKRFSLVKNSAAIEKLPRKERQEAIASEYRWAVTWLQNFATNEVVEDHVDTFFVEQVLRSLAEDLALTAKALETSILSNEFLSIDRLQELYQRLRWIFNGTVDVFERKIFASLSQEANKAMNLNSYIGLMGKSYRVRSTPDGGVLIPLEDPAKPDITVPDGDF